MSSCERFEGQVALVTGASRGIGRAIAERLADEGARLVLTATSPDLLDDVVRACRERGAAVESLAGDLTDPTLPSRLVATAESAHGSLDVVISNAFWDEAVSVVDVSLEGWERSMSVTLTAPMLLAKAAIPAMSARRSGSIVFIGSMRGVAGGHGMAAYETAKAGLFGLTRSIAIDYGRSGIRCNCVCPGLVMSERARDWYESAAWRREAMDAVVPLGRPGTPAEIANVVAFVASPEASYMNGSIVWVDGGSGSALPENAALELAERAVRDAERR
jgi:NAD(P)-dependent dehydrogenase (short-subunit alcohol dehydrogenase family)